MSTSDSREAAEKPVVKSDDLQSQESAVDKPKIEKEDLNNSFSSTRSSDDTESTIPKMKDLKVKDLSQDEASLSSDETQSDHSKDAPKSELSDPPKSPFSSSESRLESANTVSTDVSTGENKLVNGEAVSTDETKLETKTDQQTTSSTFSSSASTSGFVFGRNLVDKIANASTATTSYPTFGSVASSSPSFSSTTGFGVLSSIKPMGFGQNRTAGTSATDSSTGDQETTSKKTNGETEEGEKPKSLQKSASEEYDAQQKKVSLEEVDVITGEEGETNVFELVNVKLYGFDKDSKAWKERGRTTIRFNDANDQTYSRLVIRMNGTLRIVVNTKLWKEMMINRLSDKNVSFSAFDSEDHSPKVFLISCSVSDAEQFYSEISKRVKELARSRTPLNGNVSHGDSGELSRKDDDSLREEPQRAKKAKITDEHRG